MSQVASETKNHALRQPVLPSARQSLTLGRAPATPFADLIDSAPAPEQRPQRLSEGNAPQPDRAQNRPDSRKTAKTSANQAAKAANKNVNKSGAQAADDQAPAKTDSTADTAQTSGDNTADSAKTAKEAAEHDKTKATTDDGQPTIETKADLAMAATAVAIDPVAVAINPATATAEINPVAAAAKTDPAAETNPAAAAAEINPGVAAVKTEPATAAVKTDPAAAAVKTDPAAAADKTDPAAAADKTDVKANAKDDALTPAIAGMAEQPGTAEAGKPGIAETAKGQTDVLAPLQPKTGKAEKATTNAKAADNAKVSDKAPLAPGPDGALQAAAGEPDKAAAHAETAAIHHRGATPDAPAAPLADNTNTAAPKAADNLPPPQMQLAATPNTPASVQALAPAAAPSSEPAVPVSGVGIEIASKALSGKNQFDIRLDPPDLGRIHVRLSVDRDGNVITHMVADRSDTLDLLRRDTAGLERALQDAGLKTSDNSLQFSLRDQSGNQSSNDNASNNNNANTAHIVVEDEHLPTIEANLRDYARYGTRASGLDIRV